MSERRRVQHGPFAGYVSATDKESIGPNDAGVDSRDFLYNPTYGKWVERAGSVILGDSGGAAAPVGLVLRQSVTMRTRQIFEFPAIKDSTGTPQFTDGYPSYAALYDSPSTPVLTASGALYIRSSNSGGSNQETAKSFSATTYPLSGAKSYLKAMPTWASGLIMRVPKLGRSKSW